MVGVGNVLVFKKDSCEWGFEANGDLEKIRLYVLNMLNIIIRMLM